MAEPAGPFHLLQNGPARYLCYCCPGSGSGPGPGPTGTVYVTDALEVWAGELGARPPLGCRCLPEEHGMKLRWVPRPPGAGPSAEGSPHPALARTGRPWDGGPPRSAWARGRPRCSCRRRPSARPWISSSCPSPRRGARSRRWCSAWQGASRAWRDAWKWWRHWHLPAALRRTLPGVGSPSCQTPVPGRIGVLAQLCQPRGRSRESLSLTLASKARRHHLEWTLRTPDLCCPVP